MTYLLFYVDKIIFQNPSILINENEGWNHIGTTFISFSLELLKDIIRVSCKISCSTYSMYLLACSNYLFFTNRHQSVMRGLDLFIGFRLTGWIIVILIIYTIIINHKSIYRFIRDTIKIVVKK